MAMALCDGIWTRMKRKLVILTTIAICVTGCGPTSLQLAQEAAVNAHLKYEATKAANEARCAAGHPAIGMSELEAMEEWCFPDHINTTQTASGTREQWVYPNRGYLYFENGRLVAIQRSN
jgi:hypothetical protein